LSEKPRLKIKNFILLPIFVAFLGLIVIATLLVYRFQRLHMEENVHANIESVQAITKSHVAGISQTLNGMLEFIKTDRRLLESWQRKNRDDIFREADLIFKNRLVEQQVTHFYLIDTDNVCFLRIHKPEFYGDTIERCTLEQSGETLQPTSGLELGPLGTLTLRAVHPWVVNSETVGYIEIGVEVDNMALKLKKILGSELIFTVSKKNLDRNRWREGNKAMGRNGDWDQFSGFVVISQTFPETPDELNGILKHGNWVKGERPINISYNARKYSGGFVPLADAGDNIIGDMIVLKDITSEARLLRALLISMISLGLTGTALIFFFYFFVDRIEKRLIRSHLSLTNEISERKRAQTDLQHAHDHMENHVKSATNELTQLNIQLQQRVNDCEMAEESLRESEKKYSTLVEDSLTGVYIVQDGQIEFANEKFAEMFGYSRSELIGMKSLKLIHQEDRPIVQQIRKERLNQKEAPSVYEVRGLKKNGSIVWLLRSNALIQIEGQTAIAGSVFDITERKTAESKLRQSEKEHRVLSSKLLSVEENERKRIARNVHDSIGQALSAVKFGLENAIMKLRGMAEEPDLEGLKALVPVTQQSIEEVRRITMDLRPSILDDLGILATISWFCREFESIYKNISIQKDIDIREESIPVPVKTVIYRILQESLNNVAKHSGADHVRIELKHTERRIELAVVDNGSGFDKARILTMENVDRGLGLASIRERAELSFGVLKLQTKPGRGTQIHVSWPPQPPKA
jgi:PAS domain S-box-containing protein